MSFKSKFYFICLTFGLTFTSSAFSESNATRKFADNVLEQLVGTYMVAGPNGPETIATIFVFNEYLIMKEVSGSKIKTLFSIPLISQEYRKTELHDEDRFGITYPPSRKATRETFITDSKIQVVDTISYKGDRSVEERKISLTTQGIQMELMRGQYRKRLYIIGDWIPTQTSKRDLFYQKISKKTLSQMDLIRRAVDHMIVGNTMKFTPPEPAEVIQISEHMISRPNTTAESEAKPTDAKLFSFTDYRQHRFGCEEKLNNE